MASGFSLAFTGKKQQRRVDLQDKDGGVRKEEVTGFGKDGLQTAEPSGGGPDVLIIPKLENTYKCAERGVCRPCVQASEGPVGGSQEPTAAALGRHPSFVVAPASTVLHPAIGEKAGASPGR